jgi:hypothetical protein
MNSAMADISECLRRHNVEAAVVIMEGGKRLEVGVSHVCEICTCKS